MVDAYPLAWPPGEPRTRYREYGRFDCTIAQARDGLLRELDLLRGFNIVVSSNCKIGRNGWPLSSSRDRIDDPGVAVYFQLDGEPLVFACDAWIYVSHNLRALEKTINALRGIDRWGCTGARKRAFTGFAAVTDAASDWRAVLELDTRATAEDVNAAFRAKAQTAHPDRGGDAEDMARLNRARAAALAELRA